jgi:Cd2+/Zn2+-exporting ATPase
MEALADFLLEEPSIEAIRLNPESKRVEMATMGKVDGELLQAKLTEVLRAVDARWLQKTETVPAHSGMLDVQQKDGALVLEKPSCPTAPTFWKWRDFAWPEPDEMEQESDDEWRTLAWQAAICGVSLVAGYVFDQPALFAISLIAGGWDAAKDAWANLLERRLDVHFLMLAVATGCGGDRRMGGRSAAAVPLLDLRGAGAFCDVSHAQGDQCADEGRAQACACAAAGWHDGRPQRERSASWRCDRGEAG